MALGDTDGDVYEIKELGSFPIPGAGHNSIGIAKNNKVIRWGRMKAKYVSTGMDLGARGGFRALGVADADGCDYLSLTVRFAGATGVAPPADQLLFLAEFVPSSGMIWLVDQVANNDPTAPTDSDDVVIDYMVIGEDAIAPELV